MGHNFIVIYHIRKTDTMNKYSLLLSFLTLTFCYQLFAQQKLSLESLVPPAPNAAELGKYGTYPVGTVTGTPDISFPLYEITSGSLKLPITLSYHASGIQVSQKATDVGLGWVVNAAPIISRTVYGSPDDSYYGYFNYTPPTYEQLMAITNYYTMATYTSKPGYDLEPDLFSFNVGGKSGKFIYTHDRGFLTIPFEPVKIERNALKFQLTDDIGNIYIFDKHSKTTSYKHPSLNNAINSWHVSSIISADHSDTIKFTYESVYQEDVSNVEVYSIGAVPSENSSYGLALKSDYDIRYEQNIAMYNELLIKKIEFNNGYVIFNRNTIRRDVNPSGAKSLDEIIIYNLNNEIVKKIAFAFDYFKTEPFVDNWYHRRLKLTGFNESGSNLEDIREYSFRYDPTPLPQYGSYGIDYWGYSNGAPNTTLISNATVAFKDVRSVTYANGETITNDHAILPLEGSFPIPGGNREPSAAFMKSAVLTQIVYPTKGYSEFEFEPHQYLSGEFIHEPKTQNRTTAGIDKFTLQEKLYSFSYPVNSAQQEAYKRAYITIDFSPSNMGNTEFGDTQVVTLYNGNGVPVRTWKHEGDLTQRYFVNDFYDIHPGSYTIKHAIYGPSSVTINTAVTWQESTGQHPIKIGGGLRIRNIKSYSAQGALAKQETYKYGEEENGLGIKLFEEEKFYKNYEDIAYAVYKHFSELGGPQLCELIGTGFSRKYMGISKYNSLNYLGSPVLYSSVTKYDGNETSNAGKTIYQYDIKTEEIALPGEFVNSGNYGNISNPGNYADLKTETLFANDGVAYQTVAANDLDFTNYNPISASGVLIKQVKEFVKLNDCNTYAEGPSPNSNKPGNGFFSIYKYFIKTAASRKTKETKIIYNQTNTLETVATTKYESTSHLYPTEVITSTSQTNTSQITRVKYPQDQSDAVSMAMTSKNILAPVVEEKKYQSKNGIESLLETVKTDYAQIGTFIKPDVIKASTGNNPLEPRIHFNRYDDRGNLIEQQKTNDNKRAYVWGYNGEYAIAEVINASASDIFHTSFEDAEGNSPINDCKTGTKSRTGGFSKTLSSLSNGQYVLSYWLKSGAGWTPQTSLVTVGSGTYTISLTGQVDEIRFHPATAQMTTYSYIPLIGVSSVTDTNNITTYYEYDGLGRLKYLKDENRDIIKKIEYHYNEAK
jgi:hypothetical protein